QAFGREDDVLRHVTLDLGLWLAGGDRTAPPESVNWRGLRPRRAQQYSEAPTGLTGGSDRQRGRRKRRLQRVPHERERVRLLQRRLQLLGVSRVEPHARHVPRVELAQVARRARLAEVLDGALDRPIQLVDDIGARR